MLDAWNQRKEAHLVRDLIDPTTVTHFAKPVVLAEGAEHQPSELETALPREAFPDQQFTEEIVVSEGDLIFVGWKATGTQEGRFQGNEPTRKRVSVHGSDVLRVTEDGKIAEHIGYYSKPRVHALAQLGLLNDRTQERLRNDGLLRRGRASGIVRKRG
jgi:predicted ester cyclase